MVRRGMGNCSYRDWNGAWSGVRSGCHSMVRAMYEKTWLVWRQQRGRTGSDVGTILKFVLGLRGSHCRAVEGRIVLLRFMERMVRTAVCDIAA